MNKILTFIIIIGIIAIIGVGAYLYNAQQAEYVILKDDEEVNEILEEYVDNCVNIQKFNECTNECRFDCLYCVENCRIEHCGEVLIKVSKLTEEWLDENCKVVEDWYEGYKTYKCEEYFVVEK